MNWKPYSVNEMIKITQMFSFFKYSYDGSYKYAGESHNFWECVYILNGSICVSADERIYNLSDGEIIFHKPNEFHKFHITGNREATLLIFSFSAEGELCDYFKNQVFSLNGEQIKILQSLISYAEKFVLPDDTSYKMYLRAFENDKTYSQKVINYIYDFMLSLFQNSMPLAAYKSDSAIIFEKSVNYMREHIFENISVEEIAKHTNTSISGIKRIFSKYTGIGVHKYFLNMKIKKATTLLKQGVSVTAVSEMLSFSSQGYFTKAFKRENGELPSKYINKKDYSKE